MTALSVSFKDIDSAWDDEVSNYNIDIYHLSGWLQSSALIDDGVPQGVVATYDNYKIFFPIIVRRIDNQYWDATSTYGYGGPVIDTVLNDDEINDLMQAVKNFLAEQGCVSWFIRLHPILNQAWAVDVGTTVEHGPTLVSDLTQTEEALWQETRNQHRRGIRKALKAEVVAKVETISADNIRVFAEIYRETMTSVAASDYYLFNDAYFYSLYKNLPQRLLVITAYKDDVAIASSIQTTCHETKIMQFHLGGTLNDYRDLQPSKLITHVARTWGREAGYNYLHLGGGVGANQDSLYDYKKGFSSNELVFKTHRVITNPKKYQALINAAEHIDEESASDFFPLYRKPA